MPVAPVRKKARGRNHRFSLKAPAFPARAGYGLYVISPGTGFLAPVAHDARRKHLELGLSTGRPGPHDFAVRMHASRLAQKRLTSPRPSHPASTYRDDAYAPFR